MQSSEAGEDLSVVKNSVRILPFIKYSLYIFALEAVISFLLPLAVVVENRGAILGFNTISSLVIGWFLYKRREHLRFSMNANGFTLSVGNRHNQHHTWPEFARVSLVKDDYEDLYVRLHRDDNSYFDLPASKLKLDAFAFREKIEGLVKEK